jgi:high-affinity iron transporter
MAGEMREAGNAVRAGTKSLAALAAVVGIAVLREGSEVVLFLYGIAASGGSTAVDFLIGGALGLAAGVGVSLLTFLGLLIVPIRHIFVTTSVMIALLAGGMAAQSVFFLEQAGISRMMTDTAWDSSHILSQSSWIGRILHTLIGYSDQPSEMQAVVYVVTLAIIFALMWMMSPPRSPKTLAA